MGDRMQSCQEGRGMFMKGLVALVSIIFMLMFLVAAVTLMMTSDANMAAVFGISLFAFLHLLAAMGAYASPRVSYSIYAITTVSYMLTGILYIAFQGFEFGPVLFYLAIVAINAGMFSLSGRLLKEFIQEEKEKTGE